MLPERLLDISRIPLTIWNDTDGIVTHPPQVKQSYREVLGNAGLLDLAMQDESEAESRDGPTGGITQEDTNKHFARRFSTSSARVQLALMDPKCELGDASDLIIKAFSGGSVALLDVPSGSGPGSIGILSTIAFLRECGVMPRDQLHVHVLGGDISSYAHVYAISMHNSISNYLATQAITVENHVAQWDALSDQSTTALLYNWVTNTPDYDEHIVLLANFSDFLSRGDKFNKAKQPFGELIRWAEQCNASILWVEPETSKSRTLWSSVLSHFGNIMPRRYRPAWSIITGAFISRAKFQHPLVEETKPRLNLSLVHMKVSSDEV